MTLKQLAEEINPLASEQDRDELIALFAMGARESSSGFGVTFDDDPESPRSVMYDLGRTFGELLTKGL